MAGSPRGDAGDHANSGVGRVPSGLWSNENKRLLSPQPREITLLGGRPWIACFTARRGRARSRSGRGLSIERAHPALVSLTAELRARIEEYQAAGVGHLVVYFEADDRMSTWKVRRVDCGYCGLAIRSGRKVGAVSASLFVGPGSGPSLYRCQSRGRTRSEFHFPGECPSGVSGVETARVLGHPFAAAMPASLGGIKLRRGCPAGRKCSMKAWRRPERGTWASRVVGEERHDEG